MRREPEFDELVGGEPTGGERERLRRTHELLLEAGPPAELPPHLESGPTLAMTLARPPRQRRRRLALFAAAAVAVAVVFLAGYVAGNGNKGGGGRPATIVDTVQLRGTTAAPGALASLRFEPPDAGGNRPVTLSVTGLRHLSSGGYYAVYLVRNGRPFAPCGRFGVGNKPDQGVIVYLNAPYPVQQGDSWIVTEQLAGTSGPGQTVLAPTT